MSALFRMEWEIFYLYNGTLLDEDGNCAIAIPRLFHSVEDAETWLEEEDIRANVVPGKRKGDRMVPA